MLELNEEDEALLDSQVFNLSIQFIMHSDYASKKSALIHFTHVLGLDDKKIGYRMPNTYTLFISGLIYCLRVLVLEHALPKECRDELQQSHMASIVHSADTLVRFSEVRCAWH